MTSRCQATATPWQICAQITVGAHLSWRPLHLCWSFVPRNQCTLASWSSSSAVAELGQVDSRSSQRQWQQANMSHHFRSFSEHHQSRPLLQQQGHLLQSQPQHQHQQISQEPISSTLSPMIAGSERDRIQQSLEQLFHPVQTTVPLKDRQLPRSFFDPSYGQQNGNNNTNSPQHIHSRSVSYDQRQGTLMHANQLTPRPNGNLHTRTTSTLAPMPALVASNHCSHETLAPIIDNQTNNVYYSSDKQLDHPAAPANIILENLDSVQPVQVQPLHPADGGQLVGQPSVSLHTRTQAVNSYNTEDPQQLVATGLSNGAHSRSVSFGQAPGQVRVANGNFHMRTQSTVVRPTNTSSHGLDRPVNSNLAGPLYEPVSHMSSHEVLNHANTANTPTSADGYSSSGYSTDDMTNYWVAGQASQVSNQQQQLPHQISQQQSHFYQ